MLTVLVLNILAATPNMMPFLTEFTMCVFLRSFDLAYETATLVKTHNPLFLNASVICLFVFNKPW